MTPEQAWDNFIEHLNKTQPLGENNVKKGKKGKFEVEVVARSHMSFLGSIEKYKKVFLEANADDKTNR